MENHPSVLTRSLVALALVSAGVAAPPVAAGPVPGQPDVVVVVSPASTTTATLVRVRVTARVDDARITCVSVEFGDGTGQGICSHAHDPRPDARLGPHEVTYEWTHAYRRPGVWVVRATATAEGSEAQTRDGYGAAPVTVARGAEPSNGPHRPRSSPFQVLPPGGDRRTTTVDVVGSDEDGWITEVVVDWGDGTKIRQVLGTAGCQDPLLTWPTGRTPNLRFSHRYRTTGDRVVTATTVSTGCDGRDRQISIERARVQVPARF